MHFIDTIPRLISLLSSSDYSSGLPGGKINMHTHTYAQCSKIHGENFRQGEFFKDNHPRVAVPKLLFSQHLSVGCPV